MKQVITSGLIVLSFYHLGYFNAIHTMSIAKETHTETAGVYTKNTSVKPKLTEVKGIPLFPPDLSRIKD